MEQGWSVKRMIREIVLSRTYQLSSEFDPRPAPPAIRRTGCLADEPPPARLRGHPRRLLAVSGQLDLSPAESVVAKLNLQATGGGVRPNRPFRSVRRRVYLPVIRNDLPPVFQSSTSPTPCR